MGELIEHLKPNFFIPGAAKSGTTTLHDMLNTHPEISMSSVKEPGYWKNKNFKEFGNTEMHNYQNLFDNTKKFKGESSTAYMLPMMCGRKLVLVLFPRLLPLFQHLVLLKG